MTPNFEPTADALASKDLLTGSSGRRALTEQAHRVGEDTRELGRMALAEAGEVASHLRAKGKKALESGAEKARTAKGKLDEVVSTHPMKTVLIAAGVGALLGYALRRRR